MSLFSQFYLPIIYKIRYAYILVHITNLYKWTLELFLFLKQANILEQAYHIKSWVINMYKLYTLDDLFLNRTFFSSLFFRISA